MAAVAQTEIDIEAPIERIWQVMLDMQSYPAWNPFIERIECAAEGAQLGADLLLHVRFGGGKTVRVLERITRLDAPAGAAAARQALLEYEFLGPLASLHLVRGRRQQALAELGNGRVRYRTHERLVGLLSWASPVAKVQDGFERHAAALKRRSESFVA